MEQILNYIKVAFRSLFKFRSDAVLNVIGLSIGITVSIVVLIYVRQELAYDNHYAQSQHTYRVVTHATIGNNSFKSAMTPMPLSSFLRKDFPEIVTAVKIVKGANKLVSYKDKKFNEDNFFYADSTFFSVFDVPFLIGNASTSLKHSEDIVITDKIAKKYFADENPIGKLLKLDNGLQFYVSGVCIAQPKNSHFHFDFIASQQSIKKLYLGTNHKGTEHFKNNWLKIDWYTYFVLKDNISEKDIEEKIQKKIHLKIENQIDGIVENNDSTRVGIKSISCRIQPLESIHLHSSLDNELEANSKYLYVVLFISLVVFILLITCINFMNLTTARASLRIKEIGVRKLVGVTRKSLMSQFVVEAITYSFVALFIGLVLVELLLPAFNNLFELNLKLNRIEGRFDLLYATSITFLIGAISGIYPGIAFSRLKETSILKDGFQPQKKGVFIRGILAATQMMVTTFLIILALAMVWQIQFLKNKDLGFNSHNIIVVERGYSLAENFKKFKAVLKSIPNIQEVSASAILPGEKASLASFNYSDKNGEKLSLIPINYVEKDFLKALDVKLDAGTVWAESKEKMSSDIVINRRAKNLLEMNKPLGQRLISIEGKKELTIKGVSKDFHFEPIQFPLRPLVLMDIPKGSYYDNLLIKLSPKTSINSIIPQIKETWNHFTDNDPFEYNLLEETLDANLKEESLVLKIILVFMVLSMLIAWLGLRAFSGYAGEMKGKEFRSKKLIGASNRQILGELFMYISHFVLPGILLAVPFTYIVLNLWLNGFAYYSSLPLSLMLSVTCIVWGISFLLILLHSGKSIKSNPAQV